MYTHLIGLFMDATTKLNRNVMYGVVLYFPKRWCWSQCQSHLIEWKNSQRKWQQNSVYTFLGASLYAPIKAEIQV
jgi:hypothetical protein